MKLKDPYEIIAIAEATDSARRRKRTIVTAAVSSALSLAACLTAFVLLRDRPFSSAPLPQTILVSAADAKGTYLLPDGSTVCLNRGSSLSYEGGLDGDTRTVVLDGEAYFNVMHDSRRPFIVKARDMDIRVLGTRFTVTSYGGKPVSATLEEGSIRADLANGNTVTLSPDQRLVLSGDGSLSGVETVRAADHTSWTQERLVLHDLPLPAIARNLEHWYGVNIAFSDEQKAGQIRLSLSVKGESQAEIMALIAELAHARVSGADRQDIYFELK